MKKDIYDTCNNSSNVLDILLYNSSRFVCGLFFQNPDIAKMIFWLTKKQIVFQRLQLFIFIMCYTVENSLEKNAAPEGIYPIITKMAFA